MTRTRAIACAFGIAALVVPFGSRAVTTPQVGCSWPTKLDADTLNTAYPDESATYWGTHLVFTPGARLVVHGPFPAARYFSLHAYDEAQRPVGSLADYQIDPDSGGTNPYREAAPFGDSYTAFIEFTPAPPTPAPNTLYAGAMADGTPNPGGFILYRVYVPNDSSNPAGGELPDLSLEVGGGVVRIPLAQCEPLPPATGAGVNEAIRNASFPNAVPRVVPFLPSTTTPQFRRFFGLDRVVWDRVPPNPVTDMVPRFQGGFLSNQQIAYLYKIISRDNGDVFVLRAKAPTFPNTRPPGTDSPSAAGQVRYWSICQNELATQRFVACTPDYRAVLDAGGFFTFVISDPDDRPANAIAENGVNWLPWGGLYYNGVVIYRHMLPAAGFAGAIQNVPEFADAASIMGDYFPVSAYCTTALFESAGAAGCLAGA